MLHKLLPANPTLADRWGWLLFWLIDGMAMDWRRRGLRHVHNAEINQRILGLWKRLLSVLEQYRAGTLRAPRAVQRNDTSPRPTGSSPVAEPHSPHSGEGEAPPPAGANGEDGARAQRRRRRTPIEIADELVRRSERTGKPIDIAKVSPVVWGCIVHRPRDGNCPPPEIGYGGRRRKPPKDYTPPWD
jgi:hypothetical protein